MSSGCWQDFRGKRLVGSADIWAETEPKDRRWRVLDTWTVAEESGEDRASLKKGNCGGQRRTSGRSLRSKAFRGSAKEDEPKENEEVTLLPEEGH